MPMNKFDQYILTPKSRICRAENISFTRGNVAQAEQFTSGGTIKLKNDGVLQAQVILDMGQNSPGGYPVFCVAGYKGSAVLRISYADWYDLIVDEKYGKIGDFRRGCCKYLGVELPVLPGNPNRFELYTINRTGEYLYPLIQGQQRFVMITLEGNDCEVELSDFYIYYTSAMNRYDGCFYCNQDNINKLWFASTYTVLLASIDNSHAFEIINQKMLVRALTKDNPAGIYRNGTEWKDYTFTFRVQIAKNPDCESGIGWLVYAKNRDNALHIRLDLDGNLHVMERIDGVNFYLQEKKFIGKRLCDNRPYTIKTVLDKDTVAVFLDDAEIHRFTQTRFQGGTIGFCQAPEKWAFVENLIVAQNGKILWADDFTGNLDSYLYTKSKKFIADGAKRDRLPWIGDLDWAGRNVYYAFQNFDYMKESLKMFAFNQTPDGFVWGTCYPENRTKPLKGQYGYYESDIFSAWFVPTLADYLLFTGDVDTAKKLFRNVVADLNYLWQYVEADGLFFQRYETSKGLWDHVLNDYGVYTYNNMVIQLAFTKGAYIANVVGAFDMQQLFHKRAEIMKKAILDNLWNEEKGYFRAGKNNDKFCAISNSMGIALKYVSAENAKRLALNMLSYYTNHLVYGKVVLHFIRGCYEYELDDIAFQTLTGDTGTDSNNNFRVNWLKAITDKRGPSTVSECQIYSEQHFNADGEGWGDRSHPDTGAAHILSGYILGVQPLTTGFKTFLVKPNMYGIDYCEGLIPTPYGNIYCSCEKANGKIHVLVNHPQGTCPTIVADSYEVVENQISILNISALKEQPSR